MPQNSASQPRAQPNACRRSWSSTAPEQSAEHHADGGVRPAEALRQLDPGAARRRRTSSQIVTASTTTDTAGQHQRGPAVVGPGQRAPAHCGDATRPARSLVDRADRVSGWVGFIARRGTPRVADGEAERRDQQPEHAGDAGHVLQRRDAQQHGQPPSTSPTRPSQRGPRPERAATNTARPGEADEGPQPRDGADPVPVERAEPSSTVTSSWPAAIMNSVSSPEPRIETTAVPARPTSATTGARLSLPARGAGGTARRRRRS